jgi:hypothetical protein
MMTKPTIMKLLLVPAVAVIIGIGVAFVPTENAELTYQIKKCANQIRDSYGTDVLIIDTDPETLCRTGLKQIWDEAQKLTKEQRKKNTEMLKLAITMQAGLAARR